MPAAFNASLVLCRPVMVKSCEWLLPRVTHSFYASFGHDGCVGGFSIEVVFPAGGTIGSIICKNAFQIDYGQVICGKKTLHFCKGISIPFRVNHILKSPCILLPTVIAAEGAVADKGKCQRFCHSRRCEKK